MRIRMRCASVTDDIERGRIVRLYNPQAQGVMRGAVGPMFEDAAVTIEGIDDDCPFVVGDWYVIRVSPEA